MMSENKQCAVCKGHYDASMLAGIMDTFMCNVCALELDKIMEAELGEDYKKGLPKTSSRQIEYGIPVLRIVSPIHPQTTPEPTTA